MIDDLEEAVKTYRTNRNNGDKNAKAPYRHHKYRPLDFTKDYGWRLSKTGTTINLSRGRGQENLTVPTPKIIDPKTGLEILPTQWGSIKLCWNRNRRQWTLHIAVPTGSPEQYQTGNILAIDEGIINPVTAAVETNESYEILVVNGREARAARHYANTRIGKIQETMSRCVKGSRRWRKLGVKLRKAYAIAQGRVNNISNQTSKKTADFVTQHEVSHIIAGDVRGIEQRTFKNEKKRCRNPKTQRRRLSQWNRGQTETRLEHKTNITVEHINESYSSQTCPACLTRNHPNGRNYRCHYCGFTCHRDAVGALNILQKATYGYYKPIDTDKQIHVTYLRATPLITRKKRTLSNAYEPGLRVGINSQKSSRSIGSSTTHTRRQPGTGAHHLMADSTRARINGFPSSKGYACGSSKVVCTITLNSDTAHALEDRKPRP